MHVSRGNRVAVTGLGVVSPVGSGLSGFWASLCSGRSGISDITCFDTGDFVFKRAGEIRDFALPADLSDYDGAERGARFMLAASFEAARHSGCGTDTGLVLSTNFGGAGASESVFDWALCGGSESGCETCCLSFQSCADTVSGALGFAGPRAVISLSCSSGAAALAYGADLIRSGMAQSVLTGGYDSLSRFAWSGLSSLRTMTSGDICPFDARRAGTIFSEGAGALVLENMDVARRRGARIHAELAGWATGNNAHHMTAPAKEGAGSRRVMDAALKDAGLGPEDIDHINAHGTGTKYNDSTETEAIKAVFGGHARAVPVNSVKSMTGHMMGAAGSIEAIASVMSLVDGIVPPTINYREPDPDCDLDYVPNIARRARIRAVLSNSAGIGGCNAAVIFRKADTGE